ncbi:MAG: phosphoglucosamine mutase [Planctomycetota bacterium]|nr:MAG: phosphoglucosamine mutase [Planctomycetota bacterium]
MTEGRIFGTDGIRGRAGEGWLTPEKVARLGRAIGRVMGSGEECAALLGHDGRHSGPELESAMGAGLQAAGLLPKSAGLMTTPGLAWLALAQDFRLGVMISASHNPAEDNGIKVLSSEGEKLSDAVEDEIERVLRADDEEPPKSIGRLPMDPELELAYLGHLLSTAGEGLMLGGMVLALDCANGGGSRVAPRVFGRLGAQVHAIGVEPDGDNINRDCGSTQPQALQREVRSRGAEIGIALDGDGDRCVLVDERGELVHGDGIMTVLALHAMARGELRDPRIVATVMSNRGLHRALRAAGIEVVEVGVGDRQVVECLRRENLSLGGEQSGHIVLGSDNDHIGDGIFTALRVLRVMRDTGQTLSQLAAPYQPMPQVLLNVRVERKPSLSQLPRTAEVVKRIEADLGSDGRVLLRYSGTEPLARVMVEGLDLAHIQAQAEELANCIAEEIG